MIPYQDTKILFAGIMAMKIDLIDGRPFVDIGPLLTLIASMTDKEIRFQPAFSNGIIFGFSIEEIFKKTQDEQNQ